MIFICRENPQICPIGIKGIESYKPFIINISCGNAHVLAISKIGELYTWGLNTKGQLGVGDINVRYTPTLTTCINVQKCFAYNYSSACIDTNGQLYTWGSNKCGKLMHVMIYIYINIYLYIY